MEEEITPIDPEETQEPTEEIPEAEEPPKDSILNYVKDVVGLTHDNTAFDSQLIGYINMVLTTIYQLGITESRKPIESDKETWNMVSDDENLYSVRMYTALKVRSLFDPPTGVANEALNRQIEELEWRLKVGSETPCFNSEEVSDSDE